MRTSILGLISGGVLLAGLAAAPAFSHSQGSQPPAPAPSAPSAPAAPSAPSADTRPAPMAAHEAARPKDDFDNEKALADLQKAIAGKEDQPSEQVFKNVKMFTGVPASRLLGAMNGFSRALGVTCRRCHDVSNWASDDKDEKQAARGLMAMTKDINAKYLQTMAGVDKDASVNCSTCHRGHAHPSEGMKPPAGSSSGH